MITCTNGSVPRKVTATLGATGETGQLMPHSPQSRALSNPTTYFMGNTPFFH